MEQTSLNNSFVSYVLAVNQYWEGLWVIAVSDILQSLAVVVLYVYSAVQNFGTDFYFKSKTHGEHT
jgi:hypothetical protein